MQRREFLRFLALAAAAGGSLRSGLSTAQAAAELYDAPPFGNLSLLHVTDVHAQLLPVHFREPSVNLGDGKPPHLVGEAFLKHYGIAQAKRAQRMPSPTSISQPRRGATARSAATRTSRRW